MMGVACHLIAFIQGDQQRTCCYFLGILNVIFAFCVSPPPPPPQRSSVSPEKDCPVFCLERICHSALQRPSCLRGLDAKGAFLDSSQIPTSHCHASFLSSTGMISCPKTLALVLPEGNLAPFVTGGGNRLIPHTGGEDLRDQLPILLNLNPILLFSVPPLPICVCGSSRV